MINSELLHPIEHGAAWLIGTCAANGNRLVGMQESDPLVIQAARWGCETGQKRGIEFDPGRVTPEAVLACARALVVELIGEPLPAAPEPIEMPQDIGPHAPSRWGARPFGPVIKENIP